MRIEVEGDGVLLAATHLRSRGSSVRGHLPGCAQLPAGLHDAALRDGATTLADVLGDVLSLVAKDLELLATRVRAGVALYDRVEERLRDGVTAP